MEKILEAHGITKAFPGVRALDGVDFHCYRGEVHGLIGENGAGKSTLMKVLSGIYHPDAGELIFKGSRVEVFSPDNAQHLGIAIIHQELSLLPYMRVDENIFLGREPQSFAGLVDYQVMKVQAREILSRLDGAIHPRAYVHRLSPAQRQIVEIAKALSLDPEVMIMDEPSSSLAENELQRLFEIIRSMRENGVSVIYISHRLEEIREISDRVTVLRDGKTIGTLPIEAVDQKDLIQMMVGRDIEDSSKRPPGMKGEPILVVNKLTRNGAFKDIDLELRRGEILGVAGLIGSGRTDLARAIFAADGITSGEIYLNGQICRFPGPEAAIASGLALIPEDRKSQGLILTHTLRENISLPNLKYLERFGVVSSNEEERLARQSVSQLDIATPGIEQQIMYLSGGNQQKVALAKWMNTGPDIIIFDEPTRGIDIGAKNEIHQLIRNLADSGKSVMMISSDLPEVLSLSDRIVVMSAGQITGELPGNQATEEDVLALSYQNISTGGELLEAKELPGGVPGVSIPGRLRRVWDRAISQDFGNRVVFAILILLIVTGAFGSDRFLSMPNFTNLLRQMVIPMLLAIGQTFVILSGGIDLSVSSIVTLSNVFAAGLMLGVDQRLLPVALFCLALGLFIGILNAFVIFKLRVTPIIATLGTMVIGQGAALIYTREPIGRIPPALYTLSTSQIGPIPLSTLWVLAIIVLAYVLLYHTAYGRHLYAVGGDSEIARLSGIAVNRVRAICYMISGLLAAATGLYLTSRMGSGDPTVGPGLELDSIAAVLLGGSILGGGIGGLGGTITGVLVLGLVGNVFNQLGLRIWHQQVAKGLIIILAVVMYRQRQKNLSNDN